MYNRSSVTALVFGVRSGGRVAEMSLCHCESRRLTPGCGNPTKSLRGQSPWQSHFLRRDPSFYSGRCLASDCFSLRHACVPEGDTGVVAEYTLNEVNVLLAMTFWGCRPPLRVWATHPDWKERVRPPLPSPLPQGARGREAKTT